MPDSVDRHVRAMIEESAAVSTLQRFILKIRMLAMTSRARSCVVAVGSARPGTILAAAVVTHVALTAALARPRGAYWLMLPALFGVMALILLAVEKRALKSGD